MESQLEAIEPIVRERPAEAVTGMNDILSLPASVTAIKGTKLGDAEVFALTRFPRLVYLNLSGCDRASAEAVGSVSRLGSLKYLSLAACEQANDSTLKQLSKLGELEELDLSFCNVITDRGIFHVARLPKLRALDLNWCYDIGDMGLGALGSSKALEVISLWSLEGVTDAGVASLARLPRLKRLELPEFSAIGDRGMVELGTHAKALEELRLDHLKNLTDEGLSHVSGCQSLRRLSITDCPNITAAGVAKLQSDLPLSQITRN